MKLNLAPTAKESELGLRLQGGPKVRTSVIISLQTASILVLAIVNNMGRKTKGGAAKRGAPSATIDKINSYEDTLEEGGVDDCELELQWNCDCHC